MTRLDEIRARDAVTSPETIDRLMAAADCRWLLEQVDRLREALEKNVECPNPDHTCFVCDERNDAALAALETDE